jgi:hypothetical protein
MQLGTKFLLKFQIIAIFTSMLFGVWGGSDSFLKIGYQIWSYLTSGEGSFDDFYGDRFEQLGGYNHWRDGTLPPVAIIIGKLFYFIPEESALVVFVLLNVFLATLLIVILSNKQETNELLTITFFSYPFLFALFRGNNDIYLLSFLLAIYLLYKRGETVLSAILLGVLGALEPLMFLFSPLYFVHSRQKIKFLIIYLITYALSWYSPAFHGERDISNYFRIARKHSGDYFDWMVIHDGGLLAGNSLFGLLKTIYYFIFFRDSVDNEFVAQTFQSSFLFNFYFYIACILGLYLTYLIFREKDLKVQLVLLSCMIILLPYVSALYKFVLFLFNVLVILADSRNSNRRLNYIALILILINIPKNYIWFTFPFNPTGVTLESLVNPILIIYLIFYIHFTKGYRFKLIDKAEDATRY